MMEVEFKPRLLSIQHAAQYVGVSRRQFYEKWLPKVQSVHSGSRHLVDRESLDRLIDEMLGATQPRKCPVCDEAMGHKFNCSLNQAT